jgi:hypothetical protein
LSLFAEEDACGLRFRNGERPARVRDLGHGRGRGRGRAAEDLKRAGREAYRSLEKLRLALEPLLRLRVQRILALNKIKQIL